MVVDIIALEFSWNQVLWYSMANEIIILYLTG